LRSCGTAAATPSLASPEAPPPPEVDALVAALRRAAEAGDRARFDRLFEHVFARLYSWAWRRSGGDREQAERLAQEEMVRLTVEAEAEAS
jgi:hypothetical protein